MDSFKFIERSSSPTGRRTLLLKPSVVSAYKYTVCFAKYSEILHCSLFINAEAKKVKFTAFLDDNISFISTVLSVLPVWTLQLS